MFWFYAAFILLVLVMLALDLGVFHRRAHVVSVREAMGWSGVWIALALAFTAFVYFAYAGHWLGIGTGMDGWEAAGLYLTGYVVEKSLSLDNIFVIALIFSYFAVPAEYQHRLLFWGVIGALMMRGVMIAVGAALIAAFHWILYVFGAFLIFTAAKMLLVRGEMNVGKNPLVRLAKRFLPVTDAHDGAHFTRRIDGRRVFTPLAMALVAVEAADAIFAVDSIPAIFAITDETFLVFTSNIFAILGLRSLYFALAGIMHKFRYLKLSLALLLGLIGLKMLLKDFLHAVPYITVWTLLAVVVLLAGGIGASIVRAAYVDAKRGG